MVCKIINEKNKYDCSETFIKRVANNKSKFYGDWRGTLNLGKFCENLWQKSKLWRITQWRRGSNSIIKFGIFFQRMPMVFKTMLQGQPWPARGNIGIPSRRVIGWRSPSGTAADEELNRRSPANLHEGEICRVGETEEDAIAASPLAWEQ